MSAQDIAAWVTLVVLVLIGLVGAAALLARDRCPNCHSTRREHVTDGIRVRCVKCGSVWRSSENHDGD